MKADIIRNYIFLAGLFLLAVSVGSSETGITVSMIIILVSWLFDDKLFLKIKAFCKNRIALSFSLVYFVHVIWLWNTSDFDYAFFDLRTKFSILLFALVFSTTSMISRTQFRNLLLVHAITILICTVIGVYRFYSLELTDFRDFSPFISHIRFSLNICIVFFTILYYGFISNDIKSFSVIQKTIVKSIVILLATWLLIFLSLMQSFTGLIIIVVTVFVVMIYKLIKSDFKRTVKFSILISLFVLPVILFIWIYSSYQKYTFKPVIDISKLEKTTHLGNEYKHDTIYLRNENGKWTGLYLCENEMREAWNKRSSLKYDSLNQSGYFVSSTLIRYLTSKDIRKDQDGVKALDDQDIKNIENGIATVYELEGIGLNSRLNRIFFEIEQYRTKSEIKGSSIIQRLDLLNTSLDLIAANFFTGVGTGDVPKEVKKQLEKNNSPMKDTRMRSHNQYLSLFIAFGLFGFLMCMFSFIYPYWKSSAYRNYFVVVFLLVFFISILAEDTIESLNGATFYSFFGALYLFQRPDVENDL